MRFTTHDAAGDDAALRAARGVHDIVLEDSDCAPALKEMAPYLAIKAEGDEHMIAFGLAADVSLRFMRLNDPDACVCQERKLAERGGVPVHDDKGQLHARLQRVLALCGHIGACMLLSARVAPRAGFLPPQRRASRQRARCRRSRSAKPLARPPPSRPWRRRPFYEKT